MIQDFTHVQYFAICLKDFSPHLPSLASHTPWKDLLVHYTVLFLLKNAAHKQDKWLKNNSHNLTKINEGRGWTTGGGGGLEGRGDMHPFIPSCQWKGWRQEQQQGQRSWLAFNLCKAPGVWVVIESVSFHTQWSQRRKKMRKNLLAIMRRGESCERKSQSAVWQASSSFPSCPHSS